jgi:phospholipase C
VTAPTAYDVAVHGPNGFLREAKGTGSPGVEVAATIVGSADHPRLELTMTNNARRRSVVVVSGLGKPRRITVEPGTHTLVADPIETAHGWYDIRVQLTQDDSYLRRFAGHLENGRASTTG